ncbi:integrase [Bacillus thuringiensis serovar roskildiensis]|uniref:Integrase n=1 Tax=Bacillus thuringiensis serovar sooncheon TaxID=180891 RepID=A0A9Q5SGG8_BACTU|nr:tyrosine-type recombinase/integrase [Bacillus thuringiensis]OTW70631.1 integrase [Bacillus thuringiensis serovar coreanensis]OTX42277.1 integrase [Bacillus thuringiensis serovar sooncheon]OTX60260.1 integrase [Bacillus thuringiensis serovar guiyangiensis]OTX69126.1 integrase [Bacillus thuringiensis serovar roskildiensis]
MSKRRTLLTDAELKIATKSTYITTDEEALNLFYIDCQLRNLRPHTIKYYRESLQTKIKPLVLMTEDDIKNLIMEMQRRGLKVTTINAKLRAFKSFYNFLHKHKHIKKNPIADIKLLKQRKEVVPTLSKDQIKLLLSLCDRKTFVGVRDYTIMMLMLDTAIRVNELANIEVVDVKHNEIVIRETKTFFERIVPMSKKLKEQMEIYIKIRGYAESDKLFINQDGNELKKRSIQTRIERYGKLSGIKDVRVSAHTFRHTSAKLFIQNGGNAFHLQQLLGHTSLEITKKYVNLWATDIAESHKKYGALNNII